MQSFAIGDLASAAGVKVPTIRYYESIGLLAPPERTAGNQRRYDRSALDRLRFIAHARAMGFPMESLRGMLRLQSHAEAPCADLDAMVRDRLAEVDERIERLTRLRRELAGMLETDRHGTVGECRVIEVLSDHQHCTTEH